jgi:hypothetical protein
MTVRIAAEPLAVWDVRDDQASLWWRNWGENLRWAREHMSDCRNRCYRAEFYLIDAPCVVLHCYAETQDGRRVCDPQTGAPVLAEPVTEMLDELPPPHLLGR